ncbi:hypothetical protein MTO96_012061 [Rhipicephalus appendiculatus]
MSSFPFLLPVQLVCSLHTASDVEDSSAVDIGAAVVQRPTEAADRSPIGRMFYGSRRTQGGRECDIVSRSADRRRCVRALGALGAFVGGPG